MQSNFPTQFTDNLKLILSDIECNEFLEAATQEPVISLRYNPFKDVSANEGAESVVWCSDGYYLKERISFTLDPTLHAGGYYVQEASSMFLGHLFRQAILPETGPKISVLDLCAAPGGKSTHISSLIGTDSLLVANETISARSTILEENVIKWGLGNTIVTNSDPRQFSNLGGMFDVVSIDAPCSGEGMFRRLDTAKDEWSLSNIEMCVMRQQRIISDAFDSLKGGGFLIYSTCTFNRRENEDNVAWIKDNFDVDAVYVEMPSGWGIVKTVVDGFNCFRFYPHKCRGEGFFVSIFRKRQLVGSKANVVFRKGYKSRYTELTSKQIKTIKPWLKEGTELYYMADETGVVWGFNKAYKSQFEAMEQHLKIISPGVELGRFFRDDFKPSHALALYVGLNDNLPVPCVELSLNDTLDYLRKRDIDCSLFSEGVNLLKYNRLPIGFIKRVGKRCNNLYPKEYRIVNL